MTKEKLELSISSYCAGQPDIIACYLYGSRSTGMEQTGSDVDLAFLLNYSTPKSSYGIRKMDYYGELSKITRKEIHILIMNEAGELVLGEVLRDGIPLFIRNIEEVENFRARKIPLIAEFTYYSELFRTKLVERYGGVS